MNAPKWGTFTQVDTKLSSCATERPEEVRRVEIEKKRAGGKPNVLQGALHSLESVDIETNERRKLKKFDERHRRGSQLLKPDERKKLLRDRRSRDIETKCMQEIAARHGGAGEIRILKQHKGKKLSHPCLHDSRT